MWFALDLFHFSYLIFVSLFPLEDVLKSFFVFFQQGFGHFPNCESLFMLVI